MMKKIVLNITPATNVRSTQGDRIFFRIKRENLRPEGLKRLKRLEKYNQYKVDLLALAKEKHFILPEQGAEITFYIPIPKSWKKYKQKAMHMKLHQQKPDLSNILKAFEDGLMAEDKHIANYSGLSKIWVLEPIGRIEITIHPPKHRTPDNLQ